MKQRTWFKVFFSAAVVTALTFSGCNQAATPEGEEAVEGQAANSGNSEGSGGGLTSWFGSSEPEPEPRSVTLDAGTPIRVRTTNALSTKDVTTGEGFVGSTAKRFRIDDASLIRYIGLWVTRNDPSATYPVLINTYENDDVQTLASAAAVNQFFLEAFGAVRGFSDSGTALKQQIIAATTRAQLDAIVDPR